jgi:hypothetical protein
MSENLPSGLGRPGLPGGALGVGGPSALPACTSNAPGGRRPAAAPAGRPRAHNAEAGRR